MKSLGPLGSKTPRTLSKPAIPNTTRVSSGKISKMSRKRLRKKERTNLAGKPVADLLEALPEAPVAEILTVEEAKEAEVKKTSEKARLSRKAERRVVQHEIKAFPGLVGLAKIRESIAKRNAESAEPDPNEMK